MALRLVLVGVVAGLGLTLPSGARLAAWRDSAQSWVNARLADWDASMPAGEDAFVVVTDSPLPSSDTPSGPPTIAAADRAGTSALTPVSEQPEPPTAPVVAAADDDAIPSAPTEPTGMDDSEMGSPSTTSEAQAAIQVPADTPFDAALLAVVDAFGHDGPSPAAEAPAPGEPLDVGDDLYPGVAYALNREAEGLHLTDAARPAKAAHEIAETANEEMAYVLNTEADGLDVAGETAVASTSDDPVPAPGCTAEVTDTGARLSRAVSLTREAVSAWASLLHGPAGVSLSE
jgi:hypothetical protein